MIYPFINMGLKFPEACFILPFLESQTCIVKFVLNIWGGNFIKYKNANFRKQISRVITFKKWNYGNKCLERSFGLMCSCRYDGIM